MADRTRVLSVCMNLRTQGKIKNSNIFADVACGRLVIGKKGGMNGHGGALYFDPFLPRISGIFRLVFLPNCK